MVAICIVSLPRMATTGRIRIERQYRDPAGAKYTISYLRVYRCRARICRLLSHSTTASTLLAGPTRPD